MLYAGVGLLLLGVLALAGARSRPPRPVIRLCDRCAALAADDDAAQRAVVFTRDEIDRLGFLAWRVERHELDDDLELAIEAGQ